MSADNYWIITRHPGGGYTALMGFASWDDDEPLVATMDSPQFATQKEAWEFADQDYAEYGVRIDPSSLNEEV